jgi:transposase
MIKSLRSWAVMPIPSPSGGDASIVGACRVCTTSLAPAGPGLFPPQDRHKVVCLATSLPEQQQLPQPRWSLDNLAYQILRDEHYKDMSRSTIGRILAEAALRPHRSRYWLRSHDPDFERKVLDICRLYLDAPTLYQQGALVICVDEKTSIQALERARPTLLARPGLDERRDAEYIRHGTRCLTASRVVATGQVIGSVTQQRGRWDFVRHIRDVVARFPGVKRFHWVMDNLNTHWSLELCRYLARDESEAVWRGRPALRSGVQRREFLQMASHKHVVHFTPKHGSWMNQIEIWFGVLSRQLLRRGEFASTAELTRAILAYIAHYNAHLAYPYEWTYTGKPLVSQAKPRRRRYRAHRRRLVAIR